MPFGIAELVNTVGFMADISNSWVLFTFLNQLRTAGHHLVLDCYIMLHSGVTNGYN